jgi:hypothetical protein
MAFHGKQALFENFKRTHLGLPRALAQLHLHTNKKHNAIFILRCPMCALICVSKNY